jgi:UDPglucose--hexose-1-phosphate uridylyltransferase
LRFLGGAIRLSLSVLSNSIGDLPYNYMFYQLNDDPEYHFNVKIQPVTSIAAGFEKNTGIYINTMSPEKAVEQLKTNLL